MAAHVEHEQARGDERGALCDLCGVQSGVRFCDWLWICEQCVAEFRAMLRREEGATTGELSRRRHVRSRST